MDKDIQRLLIKAFTAFGIIYGVILFIIFAPAEVSMSILSVLGTISIYFWVFYWLGKE